jgi:plastocyanin
VSPKPWPAERLLALAALLTLAASACGGGSGGNGGNGQSQPPAATTPAAGGSAGGSKKCPARSGLRGSVNDHGAQAASGPRLHIQAADTFFAPTCQTGVRPGTVTLLVHNTGRILHNLSIPRQGVDKDVAPGQTITVTVRVTAAAVPFFCKYHRAAGMVGSLLPGQG